MAYTAHNICVYCGAHPGVNSKYKEGAIALGRAMAAHNIGLVYGGGSVGMMGYIANAVLEAGGRVIGVIPEVLDKTERIHLQLTELHLVGTMHERKALMAARADGFVALPGGYGTLEELLETITWSQLAIHSKPIVLYNIAGYYDPLLAMVDRAVAEGFVLPHNRHLFSVGETAEAVLEQIAAFTPVSRRAGVGRVEP
jgi:hypothetical protein